MNKILSALGHRRSIVAYPQIQMKYALLISSIIAIEGLCLIGIHYFDILSLQRSVETETGITLVNQLSDRTLFYEALVVLASTVLIFLVMFSITHRFLGPIIPLIRYFESIKNGDKNPVFISREEDSLKPLIDYLKTVDISVVPKQSSHDGHIKVAKS